MTDLQLEKIKEIAGEALFDDARFNEFLAGIDENPDLAEELFYFLENNNFLCKAKACGYSVTDIVVFQIDHFRARLDRDTTLTRNNPGTMILLAIETMINIRKSPEKFIESFSGETGTNFKI